MASDFVAQNRKQLDRLRTLVARLSADDMARELGGGWTVGDALVHLAFYDRRAAVLLTRFTRDGITPSPYDYDTINEVLLHFSRRMPAEMIAAEVIAAAESADAAAATTPEGLFAEIDRRHEVKLSRAEHRANHLDEIEAALGG